MIISAKRERADLRGVCGACRRAWRALLPLDRPPEETDLRGAFLLFRFHSMRALWLFRAIPKFGPLADGDFVGGLE